MKKQIRLIGIDDSPFRFTDKYGMVIGAIMRGGSYLEGILRRNIAIDGTDATSVCKDMILNSRNIKQLKAVLLDGISLGGFNVIDINELFNETNLPVLTITRDKPDFEKIKLALKKKFKDWDKRCKS